MKPTRNVGLFFIVLMMVSLFSCDASSVAKNVLEAKEAKRKSDSLLMEFKKVDQSLKSLRNQKDSMFQKSDSLGFIK